MPSYSFTAPDGTPVTIDAPEGATRADAADVLRQLTAVEGGTERLLEKIRRHRFRQEPVTSTLAGVAEPMARSALGAQQLMHEAFGAPPGAAEASERDVQAIQEKAAQMPPVGRALANVTGEAAQLYAPARAGLGLAQAAGRRLPSLVSGPSRQWLTPLIGEAGGMAAFRGLTTPGGPMERGPALVGEFASGMTGGAIGRGLEKAVRGIRTTSEAENLLGKGAELTPGHAGEHGFWPGLESRMSYMLGLAGPTGRLQQKSLDTWNQALLKEAVGAGRGTRPDQVTRGGLEGIGQAERELGRAYSETYGRLSNPEVLQDLHSRAISIQARLMDDIQRHMAGAPQEQALKDIAYSTGIFRKNLTPEGVQEYRQDLKELYADYAKNVGKRKAPARIHRRALDDWDKALDAVSPGIVRDLKGLDLGYAQVKAMEKAANRTPAVMRKSWSPQELISATKDSRDLIREQMYEGADTIGTMLGKENIFGQLMIGGGGLGLMTRDLSQAAATAGATFALGRGLINEPMRRAFLGRTDWQRAGQQVLTDRRAQMLRSAFARAAAALPGEGEDY